MLIERTKENENPNYLKVEGLSGTIYLDDRSTPNLDCKEPTQLTSKQMLNHGMVPGCAD